MESKNKALNKFREHCLIILTTYTGFDIAPSSSKIVIFENRLPIKHTFLGLIRQDLKCGLICDNQTQCLTDIITVTDFISIILDFYESNLNNDSTPILDIENSTVEEWLSSIKTTQNRQLISIKSSDSLLVALKLMIESNIRRIPVVHDDDEDNVLCILDHQRIFRFVMNRFSELEESDEILRKISLSDLRRQKIGNFEDLTFARITDPVLKVLRLLRKFRSSCVPLLDKNDNYMESYTNSDVRYLAIDKNYINLDMNVEKVTAKHFKNEYAKVTELSLSDTLFDFTLDMVSKRKLASVCIESGKVIGIVSLLDIFKFCLSNQSN